MRTVVNLATTTIYVKNLNVEETNDSSSRESWELKMSQLDNEKPLNVSTMCKKWEEKRFSFHFRVLLAWKLERNILIALTVTRVGWEKCFFIWIALLWIVQPVRQAKREYIKEKNYSHIIRSKSLNEKRYFSSITIYSSIEREIYEKSFPINLIQWNLDTSQFDHTIQKADADDKL